MSAVTLIFEVARLVSAGSAAFAHHGDPAYRQAVTVHFMGPEGEPGTALDDLSVLPTLVVDKLLRLADGLLRTPHADDPDEGFTPAGRMWRRAIGRDEATLEDFTEFAEQVAGFVYVYRRGRTGGWVVERVLSNEQLLAQLSS